MDAEGAGFDDGSQPPFSSADPLANRLTKITSIAASSATATTFRCVTGSAAARDVFMLNPQHDLTRYYSLERGREIQMNTLREIP
jgi:hypothetical protein